MTRRIQPTDEKRAQPPRGERGPGGPHPTERGEGSPRGDGEGESLAEFSRRFREERRNAPLGPVASRVLVDNERVTIWELTLAPGEASALHRHDRDYVIVLLAGDRIAAVPGPDSSRAPREAEVTPGRVVFLQRGESEWAVNVGREPYREILIELKDPASPARQ